MIKKKKKTEVLQIVQCGIQIKDINQFSALLTLFVNIICSTIG